MGVEEATPDEPTDVFVSYRRSDREFVDALVRTLEGRGAAVWWDADIVGGHDWRESIVAKLQDSEFIVLVFSEECNSSTELRKELAVASHLKKDVVPVLIEHTEPRGTYLYELAGRNWINIAPDAHTKIELLADRLISQIKRPIRPPEVTAPQAAVLPPPPTVPQPPTVTPTTPPPAPTQPPTVTPTTPPPAPTQPLTATPTTPPPAPTQPLTATPTTPATTPQPSTGLGVGDGLGPAPSWVDRPPAAPAPAAGDRSQAPGPAVGHTPSRPIDRAEIEAAIDADARPDPRDFLPFRWYDFILPVVVFGLALLGSVGDPEMTAADALGMSLGMAVFVLGLVGVIVVPVRYYRRRRSPYRVLKMLSLTYLVLAAGTAVGFSLARDYLAEGDPELEASSVWADLLAYALGSLIFFVPLSVLAFTLFWVLSKRRARHDLRADMETL